MILTMIATICVNNDDKSDGVDIDDGKNNDHGCEVGDKGTTSSGRCVLARVRLCAGQEKQCLIWSPTTLSWRQGKLRHWAVELSTQAHTPSGK